MKKVFILITFSLILSGCGNKDFKNYSTSYSPAYYGSEVMLTCKVDSGNCYNLDVHREGDQIKRIYFSEKGYVDVKSTYRAESTFYVIDENGNEWELEF